MWIGFYCQSITDVQLKKSLQVLIAGVYVSFSRNNGEEDVNVNSVVVNYKIVVSSLFLI